MKIKNMMKKGCFCMIIASFLTGCSANGTINNIENIKTVLIENLKYMNMQFNNPKMDENVYAANEEKYKQFKITSRIPDENAANKRAALFAQGNEIVNVEKIKETGTYVYTYSNKSKFYDSEYCSYRTQDSEKRHYNLYISQKYGIPGENFPLKELEDFPLDQAVKQIRELCEQMGIELSAHEPEVFALDVQHVTKLIEQDKRLGYYVSNEDRRRLNTNDIETYGEKITWDKEDEVYYMTFGLAIKGHPFSQKGIDSDSYYSNTHELKVIIGRNEIKEFLLSFEYGDKEWNDLENSIWNDLEDSICSDSEALKAIVSQPQYSYGFYKHLVSNTELVYIPISKKQEKEFSVRPCWQFTVEYDRNGQKDGELYSYKEKRYYTVDAINKTLYKTVG